VKRCSSQYLNFLSGLRGGGVAGWSPQKRHGLQRQLKVSFNLFFRAVFAFYASRPLRNPRVSLTRTAECCQTPMMSPPVASQALNHTAATNKVAWPPASLSFSSSCVEKERQGRSFRYFVVAYSLTCTFCRALCTPACYWQADQVWTEQSMRVYVRWTEKDRYVLIGILFFPFEH